MQSFRYQLSHQPRPPRRSSGAWRTLAACLAVAGVGAGLWWGVPASGVGQAIGAMLVRPAGAAERGRELEALLREGDAHLAGGRAEAAVGCYDRAIALAADATAYRRALDARYLLAARGAEAPAWPDGPAVALAKGAHALAAGRAEAALRAFDEAVAIAPKDPRCQLARHAAFSALEKPDRALEAAEAAQRLAPHDPAVIAALVAARSRVGDGQRAVAEAVAAYRPRAAQTTDEAVHVGLLEAYWREGLTPAELKARHEADAPQLTAAARETFMAMAAMRHYRRNPHWNQQAFDQVIEGCQRVLAIAGADASPWRQRAGMLLAEAYAARGTRFLERSDFEAARVQLTKALGAGRYLAPEARAELHVQLARVLPLVGKADGAVKELEKALALHPTHPCKLELARWHGLVGLEMLSAGRAKEAVKPLQRALAADPSSPVALARLHQALSRTGDHAPLTAAAKVAGLSLADARVRLGEGLLLIGKKADAQKAADAAARAGAPAGPLAVLRAELAIASGQRSQARLALLAAIEHGGTAERWSRLGEVDAALANKVAPAQRPAALGRAAEDWRHALALAPDDKLRGRLAALHKALAEDALRRKDWAGARRFAADGLLLVPGNAALCLAEGDALKGLEKPLEARAAYELGLASLEGPTPALGAAIRDRLGHLLLETGEYDAAIAVLKTGLATEASASPAVCASMYYALALACRGANQPEAAVEAAHQYLFWSFHDPHEIQRVPEIQRLESQLAKS
jgi:tetratricopeptide (TPR) repeat protein